MTTPIRCDYPGHVAFRSHYCSECAALDEADRKELEAEKKRRETLRIDQSYQYDLEDRANRS
jgi:hypothetical protein